MNFQQALSIIMVLVVATYLFLHYRLETKKKPRSNTGTCRDCADKPLCYFPVLKTIGSPAEALGHALNSNLRRDLCLNSGRDKFRLPVPKQNDGKGGTQVSNG